MTRHEFSLFADYFQFYVQDDFESVGNLSTAWTQEAVDRLLAVAPGIVGVGTLTNMDVPVTIEIHHSEPAEEFQPWDHIAECDLQVKSGRLVVAGCTEYFPEAARISLLPGLYRVRSAYGDMDSRFDGGLEGNNHYRLQIWPVSEPDVVRVLKQGGKL